MKKTFLLLLLTPTLLFAQPHKKKIAENPKLSLNRIFTTSDFSSVGAGQFYMLPDGGYARQGAENIIYKYQFGVDKAVDSILYPAKIRGFPAKFSMEEFVISASGNLFLLKGNSEHIYRHSNRAEYYLYDKSSNKIHKVFEAGSIPRLDDGRIFYATISPDEKNIAFVYRNNLYMEAVDGGNLTQITRDGEMNKIINGKSDWVYEEEFVVVQAFEWSPKGDKIAFYRFDESKVKEYTLTKYDSLYPTQYTYKYPVSGEDNSEVSIWIYDINSKGNKKLDVGEKKDQYIPRIKWTRDNNLLSIQRMNRMQNHLELLIADASSGSIKKLYDEENKTYIDITDNLYFMPDNSFIMSSGKEGFNQFYYYDAGGKLIRKLTPYEADINDIITMDEKTRTLYYHTQKGSPMDRYVYKVNLDSGVPRMIMPKVRKVAGQDKGQFNIQYSSDFKYYVFSYSSSKLPLHVELYNSEDKLIKIYADNAKALANAKEVGWVEKEFIKIPISKTEYLNAWIIKPPKMSKTQKYPVLFTIYSGPGSQTVTNSWGGGMEMWYNYLAQHDIIVVSVDNRGTGGRGEDWQKCTYKKLGDIESDDQITAAKWLATQSYVDSTRIGMYGWSFGGYMSSLCLMKGFETFKTAVAVAPVTDWSLYDNIYTERYMQRPKDNPEGYKITSVIPYAKNLKGNYLLIHGTFDDNVHPQNSILLMDELIKGGKTFNSEFYPNKAHGISGGNARLHVYTRITEFLLEKL